MSRGWNLTGDTYRMDEDGYFWYQARSDDMIISAGYNISGPEVVGVLLDHPKVRECAVVGSPDPERGMIVKAFVVLREPRDATPDTAKTLQDFVKNQIAPYKYPRAVAFIDALPRTETGKVQQGLRFKVLRSEKFGDVGMIEYAPGKSAWRPVEAEGYLVIRCLMVNSEHKGKGLGTLLLNSCLRDAKKSKCRGVAVVTSSDSFMAGSDLFIKAGFVSVDRIPPYELLVKKLKKTAPDPRLSSKGSDCSRGTARASRSWLPISARWSPNGWKR